MDQYVSGTMDVDELVGIMDIMEDVASEFSTMRSWSNCFALERRFESVFMSAFSTVVSDWSAVAVLVAMKVPLLPGADTDGTTRTCKGTKDDTGAVATYNQHHPRTVEVLMMMGDQSCCLNGRARM